MNILIKKSFIAILLLLFHLSLFAGLEFEEMEQKFELGLSDKGLTTVFKFKNNSDKMITINDIKVGCGCTTTELTTNLIKAGESAELKVVYTVREGKDRGTVSKRVLIYTDEPESKPIILTLTVTIPELFTMEPEGVLWIYNDISGTRIIDIKMTEAYTINLGDIRFTEGGFNGELITIKEGKEYQLKVSPKSDTKDGHVSEIFIETDYLIDGKPYEMISFAIITKEPTYMAKLKHYIRVHPRRFPAIVAGMIITFIGFLYLVYLFRKKKKQLN